jgi:hypothetical protein
MAERDDRPGRAFQLATSYVLGDVVLAVVALEVEALLAGGTEV